MEFFRYCRVCGAENPDTELDCSKCGISILDVIPEEKRNPLPIENPTPKSEEKLILSLENGQEFIVKSGDVIGRSNCGKELLKENTHVSRKHASIQNIEGIWVVKDENTLNGTFINGEKIEPGIWKKIKPGDKLELSPACCLVVKF